MDRLPVAKILMVDDEPANLLALDAVLTDLGQNLIHANSGEEALRRLLSEDFAVILLDVQMPGMDGFETASLIRRRERSRQTPIIFLTALSEEAFQGYEAGAVDYIIKPIVPEIIKAKVAVFVELYNKTRDITERKEIERMRAEVSLREHQKTFHDILESMGDGVIVCDRNGTFLFGNPAAERIIGLNRDADDPVQRGQHYPLYLPNGTLYPEHDLPLARAICGEAVDGAEALIKHPVAGPRWVSINARPLHDSAGIAQGGVAVFRDVSERKEAEQRLIQLAQYDDVTGLPNRNLLHDRLAQAMTRATAAEQSLALMFLDLDHFKDINDTLGHELGNRLLKAVGERLTLCAHATDTVARLGGDEFTVVLEGRESMADIAALAHQILAAFTQPYVLDEREIFLSASIGITQYPGDASDISGLFKKADVAMYHAKGQGRNNYQFYHPGMYSQVLRRMDLAGRLRRALNKNELLVYYQPQIDLRSGQIVGVEALLRWRYSQQKLLSPTQFITLAEETGLIVPIGEWVLHTACHQNRAWQDAGLAPVTMAVNLSTRQFRHAGLRNSITHALADSGLDNHLLHLEITEGVLLENTRAGIALLAALQETGIQISIDDFGTGYSSLSYLKNLPLDTLKIDRSFIKNITRPESPDAAITTAIITLAHSLHLSVVAEGVETEEQLALLREKNCDYVQGYLFSRPLPAEECAELLRNGCSLDMQ